MLLVLGGVPGPLLFLVHQNELVGVVLVHVRVVRDFVLLELQVGGILGLEFQVPENFIQVVLGLVIELFKLLLEDGLGSHFVVNIHPNNFLVHFLYQLAGLPLYLGVLVQTLLLYLAHSAPHQLRQV